MREIVFKAGSVEKLLRVFIREKKRELPQYYVQQEIGSGTYYDALKHLEKLGVLERGVCFDQKKNKEVTCVKLTEAGEKLVEYLRKIYEVLNTGSSARSSSSSNS